MAAKFPHPVASCTACGAVTHNDDAVNTRCDHMVKGVRCDGVYQSRVNPAGWRECPACLANRTHRRVGLVAQFRIVASG